MTIAEREFLEEQLLILKAELNKARPRLEQAELKLADATRERNEAADAVECCEVLIQEFKTRLFHSYQKAS